jgi:hypothetical protein
MMEAMSSSETSASMYQTTLCYIPEGSYLHTRSRENLESQRDIRFPVIQFHQTAKTVNWYRHAYK